MFTFQSLGRSLDLQLENKKVVSFRNYTFTTADEKLASLVRAKAGPNMWEVGAILETVKLEGQEQPEEPEVVKPRRGRPPKNLMIQGMRSTAPIDEGEST